MADPRIGIITALNMECWAMKALLESPKEINVPGSGAGHLYYLGDIPARDGGRHNVVLCFSGVGNNSAAIRATLLLSHFQSIASIIMVGIAGGVPNPTKVEEHVRLGDIVVSDKGGVVKYDFGKEIATTISGKTTVEFIEKYPPRAPSSVLLESVSQLEVEEYDGHRTWIDHIENACKRFSVFRPPPQTDILISTDDSSKVIGHPHDPSRIPGQPRLFLGKIASADMVLKNPIRRDYLRDKFGVKAVEMEGAGIADASWTADVGYLVVRGICDYCDSNKGDDWQKYAAVAAAGYVRALIESMPAPVKSEEGGHGGVRTNATLDEYLAAIKVFSETDTYITLHEHTGVPHVPLLLRRKDPQTDEQKKPSGLSAVLNEELNELGVMFVGGGGAGKSTLLRQIAKHAWEVPESLGLHKRYLPMVIRLSALATTEHIDIEKRLRDAMYKAGELSLVGDLPNGFFSDWPIHVGAAWLLLFDGLDEVATEQRSSLLAKLSTILETLKAGGHRVALTSRPGSFVTQLESKLTPYTVLGFTSQQQREFAQSCFGREAERFLMEIEGLGADDFNGNPLLFTIAAVVFRLDRRLVENKASLYERFIQIWLDEATERGLKLDLGDDLYDLVPSVLAELAFQMTEQPGEGSSVALSRKLALFLKDKLGVPIPKALAQGTTLVNVLGTRSGVFVKAGDVCDWAHSNFREYLAARALDAQLFESSGDCVKVLGDRPFDSNWSEVISTLVQLTDKSADILNWIAVEAMSKANAQSSLLVHYYWTETHNQDDPATCKIIVDVLLAGFGDSQAGLRAPEFIKAALVGMGSRAVPALLVALKRFNGLQKELFPEWKGKKAPDIYSEGGDKVYKGYRQRQRIIEVFGQIKDPRTFDDLIGLLYEDEGDSNRLYLRLAAQKALTCIGEGAVEPLLKIIGDINQSREKRRQALIALRSVGRRKDEVSRILDECLREGLSGNSDLLKVSLSAATGLRDRKQSAHAAEILKLNDQELVGKAAEFFSAIPDGSVFTHLATALNRWKEMEPHPFSSDFGMKRLLSALVLSGDPSAGQMVRTVILSSLRGDGELGAHEALREAEKISIAGLRRLILTASISQLRESEPRFGNVVISFLCDLWASIVSVTWGKNLPRRHKDRIRNRNRDHSGFRLSDAIRVLRNTWRPDELRELVKTTQKMEGLVEPGSIEKLISRYLRRNEDLSETSFVDDSALLHILAKCQVRQFGAKAGRLLEKSDWDFQRELSDVLWIAGDVQAEEALLGKLRIIKSEHTDGEDSIPELYHVIRALGTCGTPQGAEKVIETVLESPKVNVEFSKGVLWPLLRRRVLDPYRLIRLAENSSTHKYARNFFVEAVGYFDAPTFSEFFARMLTDEDEHVRINAAHFLGWSPDPNSVTVLIDLLQKTDSPSIAETAAGSLRKLQASKASVEIVKVIERFGAVQRVGLIREAARLKNPSVVKYLKGTTRSNEWTPWERGDLLDAVGEFYEEPWARTILEEWLENTRIGYDTGQQRWAFGVLAKHDPDKLLTQAVRLYDENGLENSSRSRLVVLLARLVRTGTFNSALLLPLLKRLLCDEDLWMRESVAEDLVYLNRELCWQIYEELSSMGNDWPQACGVYSLGFWDSDESEIERMRYSAIHMVRYFADLALAKRRRRSDLRQLSDLFVITEGAARVSSYLALRQEGSEQDLHYIDEQIKTDSITSVFLPHMQSTVQSEAKKRQEKLMKEEQALFCKSSREVDFS